MRDSESRRKISSRRIIIVRKYPCIETKTRKIFATLTDKPQLDTFALFWEFDIQSCIQTNVPLRVRWDHSSWILPNANSSPLLLIFIWKRYQRWNEMDKGLSPIYARVLIIISFVCILHLSIREKMIIIYDNAHVPCASRGTRPEWEIYRVCTVTTDDAQVVNTNTYVRQERSHFKQHALHYFPLYYSPRVFVRVRRDYREW